ncbi:MULTISPECIES: FecCD family ABC transporter permease [Clostridium]|uniref:FecCD family ABC transporter permease n=1 Tax=Clostridium TaxID=1485 RepID=UPI0021526CDF|nr:iron ABC transporter permease [Clostridium sp. LY3-2]MCR6514632.1 iron ABC transporter permease [Clostridium sp. LY3-2]
MIKRSSILLHVTILIILSILSLCIGRYELSPLEILNTLIGKGDMGEYSLLINIRIPRIILVVISGGALALSGMVFQSMFQNPLISPDVLGVTSGCSLGAALGIVFLSASPILVQSLSFTFGLLAVIFSVLLSKRMRSNRILALVISGIVTGALTSSMIMIIKYFADPYKDLPAIDFWLMGGFYNSSWSNIAYVSVLCLFSTIVIYLFRWRLKVITMGDESAKLLGVNVKLVRLIVILASTLLVSAVVSVAGVISWIGILVPHIVKSYAKDDISKNIPITILAGGIILLLADTLARSITTTEIPISIVTSFVGAPFLVYLLNKKGTFKDV